MEDLLDVLPDGQQRYVYIGLAIAPYISRGFYALIHGGGIKGFFRAIWLGTNTPKKTDYEIAKKLNEDIQENIKKND